MKIFTATGNGFKEYNQKRKTADMIYIYTVLKLIGFDIIYVPSDVFRELISVTHEGIV